MNTLFNFSKLYFPFIKSTVRLMWLAQLISWSYWVWCTKPAHIYSNQACHLWPALPACLTTHICAPASQSARPWQGPQPNSKHSWLSSQPWPLGTDSRLPVSGTSDEDRDTLPSPELYGTFQSSCHVFPQKPGIRTFKTMKEEVYKGIFPKLSL